MTLETLPRRGAGVRRLDLPLPAAGASADGPPDEMPLLRHGRPLKRWRYVGVYGAELMLCVGDVRIGPVRQRWWAVAEPGRPLVERTSLGSAGVTLDGPRVRVESDQARIDVALAEGEGCEPVETVSRNGASGYVWTRKQAGVPARGIVELGGRTRELSAEAVVDDTAGYHARHSAWRWSAGVGRAAHGERVGWNLVTGVNDDPKDSERSLWVGGEPVEVGPVAFVDDLSAVSFAEGGRLEFTEWSAREHRTNLLLVRSSYRQPFGAFAGHLPGGIRLAEGYGVMEEHDVRW